MAINIYRGNIIYSEDYDNLKLLEHGYLVVKDDEIVSVTAEKPECCFEGVVKDFGDALIIPSFSDLHIHAPQYVERGVGMDCLLFDWLQNYTFPQEAKFANPEHVRNIYPQVVRDFIKHGTTQATIFTTLHYDACFKLIELLRESGMYAYTGLTNMDRNCPDFYVDTTEESLRKTEQLILNAPWNDHVKPVMIPRFAPTCTRELMQGLGKLARKYNIGLHTHLVESIAEAAWTKELFPECASDGEIYEKCGLLENDGVKIFAHVIFPTETEERILKQYNAISVHCPDATSNITAGIMPLSTMHEKGLEIALGTDVGGGHFFGLYRQIARAVQISKMKEFYEPDYKRIVFANAFYLATVTGGKVFGNIGKLEPGYKFNALVIDGMQDEGFSISPLEQLERFCYIGDDRNIIHRFIDGKEIDPEEVYQRLKACF